MSIYIVYPCKKWNSSITDLLFIDESISEYTFPLD